MRRIPTIHLAFAAAFLAPIACYAAEQSYEPFTCHAYDTKLKRCKSGSSLVLVDRDYVFPETAAIKEALSKIQSADGDAQQKLNEVRRLRHGISGPTSRTVTAEIDQLITSKDREIWNARGRQYTDAQTSMRHERAEVAQASSQDDFRRAQERIEEDRQRRNAQSAAQNAENLRQEKERNEARAAADKLEHERVESKQRELQAKLDTRMTTTPAWRSDLKNVPGSRVVFRRLLLGDDMETVVQSEAAAHVLCPSGSTNGPIVALACGDVIYFFRDTKLTAFQLFFSTAEMETMVASLTERYGSATSSSRETVKTAAGASFPNQINMWATPEGLLETRERFEQLDRGVVQFNMSSILERPRL